MNVNIEIPRVIKDDFIANETEKNSGPVTKCIWIDPNIEDNEGQKNKDHFEQQFNLGQNFVAVDNMDSGIAEINTAERCVVLTSGKLAENVFSQHLVEKIHHLKNVHFICVYCGKKAV